jgi:hypothetical protein
MFLAGDAVNQESQVESALESVRLRVLRAMS